MRFACLGSGSQGNSLVIEVARTRLLLDCGFTLKEVTARLSRLGLQPDMIDGIVITHEHEDHIGGVERFARRFDVPVWLTHGTLRGAKKTFSTLPRINIIDSYQRFSIGDIDIEPYPVPHDALEPTQFIFGDGAFRLGVLTDTGCSTTHIEMVLSRCHALVHGWRIVSFNEVRPVTVAFVQVVQLVVGDPGHRACQTNARGGPRRRGTARFAHPAGTRVQQLAAVRWRTHHDRRPGLQGSGDSQAALRLRPQGRTGRIADHPWTVGSGRRPGERHAARVGRRVALGAVDPPFERHPTQL